MPDAASGERDRDPALHTSHAFHSSMLEPVLAPFTAIVEKVALSPPTLPYISNVTGDWISSQQAVSPAYYAQHLRQTVQFEAGIRVLARDPMLHFLEVGPGNTLTSLARLCIGPDGMRRTSASLGTARDKPGEVEGFTRNGGSDCGSLVCRWIGSACTAPLSLSGCRCDISVRA